MKDSTKIAIGCFVAFALFANVYEHVIRGSDEPAKHDQSWNAETACIKQMRDQTRRRDTFDIDYADSKKSGEGYAVVVRFSAQNGLGATVNLEGLCRVENGVVVYSRYASK